MAETKEEAEQAFNLFINKYQAKYSKAVECLLKTEKHFSLSMTFQLTFLAS